MFRTLLLFIACGAASAIEPIPLESPFLVHVWRSEDGLPSNVVRSVDQGPDGRLWIATPEGVATFDGSQFETLSQQRTDADDLENPFRVFALDDGTVWISTYGGDLFRAEAGRLERIELGDAPGTGDAISLVTRDAGKTCFARGGQLWQLGDHGAEPLPLNDGESVGKVEDYAKTQERRGRSPDQTQRPTHLIDHRGGEWEIAEASLRYQPSEQEDTDLRPSELSASLIASDLLEDREGNLWIASPVEGLIRVRHRRVTPLAPDGRAFTAPVNTALKARDGTWWIATRSGVVERIRDGTRSHHLVTGSDIARPTVCIFEDSQGRLWFATRDGAVKEWNEETQQFEGRFTRIPHLSKIRTIAEDGQGRLWFGGLRGLFRWNGSEMEDFSDDPSLDQEPVSCLVFDKLGNLYAGTGSGRLLKSDGAGFAALSPPSEHFRDWISSIVVANDNEVWTASIGSGLAVLRNGKWQRFGSDQGLPEDRLTALTLVGDDELWIGSLSGIFRVSRSELLASIEAPGLIPVWLQLDRSDGMISRECVGRSQPCVIENDGLLWFPTAAGLAGVHPRRMGINSIAPELIFKPAEVNGIPARIGSGPLEAGPGRTRLTFAFRGINLTAPEKLTYQVRMAGLEDEAQLIGHEGRVSYPAVPPGNYALEVIAINGDGVASPAPAVIPVHVRHHFWQTPWFLTIATIVAAGITLSAGALISRLRVRRRMRELKMQRMLETERTRISRDLHDELGASLTEVSILSALANEDPDDETLRPSLQQLTLKAQQAVGDLDEIVWATNPKQDSLRSLVEYLDYSAQDLLKTVRIPLQCTIAPVTREVVIGPRRRHNVVLATREAINNAVKHANPTSIHLAVFEDAGKLIVRIADDGEGIEPGSSTLGFGLNNLRQRMEDCGGSCDVQSKRGEGTTVTLALPLPT